MTDAELRDATRGLEHADVSVRKKAAWDLSQAAKLKDTRVVGPLLAIASDPDSEMRYLAVSGLGKFPSDARVVELLIHGLTDRDPKVRRVAARGLEPIKTTKVFDALWSAARDPDPDVAWAAGETLQKMAAAEIEQLRSVAKELSAELPPAISRSTTPVPKRSWWQFWK